MISLLGREVVVLKCSNTASVGLRGVLALESFKTLTITSATGRVTLPKSGTALQLVDSGKVILADEMVGRIEDRLAKGSRA